MSYVPASYRDYLKQVIYTPYSRVDVRRIIQLVAVEALILGACLCLLVLVKAIDAIGR